jgi:pantetheine-phosphate adenylyltransferase
LDAQRPGRDDDRRRPSGLVGKGGIGGGVNRQRIHLADNGEPVGMLGPMRIKKPLGVYAGSFDPLTIGHLWMIEQGVRLFDRLIVAVGINPDKRYTFSLEDRLAMLRESLTQYRNLSVTSFSNRYLIDYAQLAGATHVLRGIRSESDYEYERTMRNINGDLDSRICSVFLMPPRDIAEVSSSMVKGLVGPKGWPRVVRKYVPEPVYRRFRKPAA